MKNPWKQYSKVNPQRENGNRQISSEVFQALMKTDLNGSEFRIIMAVLDKTWGFQKEFDAISISQLSKMTCLTSRGVQKAVKDLKEKRIIHCEVSNIRANSGSPFNAFMFNKHYDTWKAEGRTVVQGVNKQVEKGEQTGKRRVNSCSDTKETITKETITKENYIVEQPQKEQIPYQEIIAFLNQKTGKQFKHTGNTTRRHIQARWKEGFRLNDFHAVVEIKAAKWLHDSKMVDFLRPETLFGNKFESYLNESKAYPLAGKISDKAARTIRNLEQFISEENDEGQEEVWSVHDGVK